MEPDEQLQKLATEQARQSERIKTLEREMSNRTQQLRVIEEKLDRSNTVMTRIEEKVLGMNRVGWLVGSTLASLIGAGIIGFVTGQIHIGGGS